VFLVNIGNDVCKSNLLKNKSSNIVLTRLLSEYMLSILPCELSVVDSSIITSNAAAIVGKTP
jgi:hypothetical protein